MAVTVLHWESIESINKIGYVGEGEPSEAYTEAHDAETGTVFDAGVMGNSFADPIYFRIWRNFFYYDTSGIGAVNISGARLIVAATTGGEADTNHSDIYIVEGAQNIPTPVPADYGAHREFTTPGGILLYENIVYYPNYIVLNSVGLSWINTSGNTLFCSRVRGDVEAWEPTGTNRASFILPLSLDIVSTDAATDIGAGTATLNGTFKSLRGAGPYLEVTHDGANPTYPRFRFEYGTSYPYDTYTDWQYGVPLGSAFSADLTGLSPDLYRFWAIYEDADGEEKGDQKTFTITIPPIELRYFAWII